MSEQEKSISKKQCMLCGGLLVMSLLLLGATGMNNGIRKSDERRFLLNCCRFASAGFAEKTAQNFQDGFKKIADNDPEFMLRLNSADLR